MRIFACYIFFALSIPLGVWASSAFAAPIEFPKRPSQRPELKSIYAGVHQLTDFLEKDTKALVCVFTGRDCPVAQQYAPKLKWLFKKHGPNGFAFLAVFANTGDHVLNMAQYAHDADLPFPPLLDVKHKLADLLDVQRTPEVVVIDAKMEVRYQGAIDNQFTPRGQIHRATQHYLDDALTNLAAGKPVKPDYVPAAGCPLERQPRLLPPEPVSYFKHVAPILQKHCQSCHREGEVGPFDLISYEDAYNNATKIAEVVEDRRMPPWHGYLNPKFGKLQNDKRLSDDEIDTLLAWVAQEMPRGNSHDAPPPINWPSAGAWKIGRPDFVYRMPEPFRVPKSGVLDYQFFRVNLNFQKDHWFGAVEVKPGNAEVVHHVGLHIVPSDGRKYTGFTGMAALYGFAGEQGQLLNDYVPGDTYNAKVYPPGQGVRIPAGSDLIYELHYTPNNRAPAEDQSMVAFRWLDKPPADEVLTEVFRKPIGRFRIPPGHPHLSMSDTYYFPHDIWVDAIRPHFHLRAKSFRLEIIRRRPRSDKIQSRHTLLTTPVWDPDWQRTYELEKPLWLAAGTELRATAVFDNSKLNPNNPDPSAAVYWGQQTTDEMFSVRFKFRRAKKRPKVSQAPQANEQSR